MLPSPNVGLILLEDIGIIIILLLSFSLGLLPDGLKEENSLGLCVNESYILFSLKCSLSNSSFILHSISSMSIKCSSIFSIILFYFFELISSLTMPEPESIIFPFSLKPLRSLDFSEFIVSIL